MRDSARPSSPLHSCRNPYARLSYSICEARCYWCKRSRFCLEPTGRQHVSAFVKCARECVAFFIKETFVCVDLTRGFITTASGHGVVSPCALTCISSPFFCARFFFNRALMSTSTCVSVACGSFVCWCFQRLTKRHHVGFKRSRSDVCGLMLEAARRFRRFWLARRRRFTRFWLVQARIALVTRL